MSNDSPIGSPIKSGADLRTLSLDVADRVARLTLQRPEAGNAFTMAMMREFIEALAGAAGKSDILVIRGAGADFCLGRDRVEPMQGISPAQAFQLVTDVNAGIDAYGGIVINAVQGRAFGFGVGLVMRADIALAAQDARFALDEIKLGIPPMFIMSRILDHLPPKAAFDIVASSREFGASEALALGLVSRVVPAAALQTATDALAAELRGRKPEVLRASKAYMLAIRQVPRAERAAYALEAQTGFAMSHAPTPSAGKR